MNFVFISPQFPETYWQWCARLRDCGASVYGIGDEPKDELPEEVLDSLDEYFYVTSLEDYDQVFRAVAYFSWKHGHMDWIESMNEHWLALDARLRDDFHVTTGASAEQMAIWQSKARMKELYAKGNIPTARQVRLGPLGDIRRAVDEWGGYPIFAKPEVGVGSAGGRKLHNEGELRALMDQLWYRHAEPYVLEEFVPASGIVAYDAILDSHGNPLFENQEEFPPSMSDIATNGLDLTYYSRPDVDPRLADLGRRTAKAFGLVSRFVHMEFFRLAEDREGLGARGDYVGLEVNCRPAGGYTPDMMNFAHSTDVYRIWADMVCFDERRGAPDGQGWWCVYAGRRNGHSYAHTREDILDTWSGELEMERDVAPALSNDMGDHLYVARVDSPERMQAFANYVHEGASS